MSKNKSSLILALIAPIFSWSVLAITKFGVIVPLEHQALRAITEGFKRELAKDYSDKQVEIIVQNAQGDANLQRSMINNLIHEKKVDFLVPIGQGTTQMAVSLGKGQVKILALAVLITEEERQKLKPILLTGVHDEVPPQKQLDFFFTASLSKMKKMAIIYSGSEKVLPEVREVEHFTKERGLILEKRMIQTLPELYSVVNSLPSDVEMIYVLKDHVVVSGMATLAKMASKRKILIMSSDEGSVQEGACLALGVREASIGEEGAKLAKKILQGTPIADVPMHDLKNYSLFTNAKACTEQGFSLKTIEASTLQKEIAVVPSQEN